MHLKITPVFRHLVLLMIAICAAPSWSQQVNFQSNATANACIDPPRRAILHLQNNCNVQLGAGNATVLTCSLQEVGAAGQGWHGNFVPVGNHTIQIGWGCFFENCGPGGLTLTCFVPVFHNHKDFEIKEKLTIKFDKEISSDLAPKK